MKLENQVVSLELPQKMKELGFEQESYFKWFDTPDGYYESKKRIWQIYESAYIYANPQIDIKGQCSAYTVAELAEMLPVTLPIKARATDYSCEYSLAIDKVDEEDKWEVSYCGTGDAGCEVIMRDDSLADACADVLIHLKENNLYESPS